jgi:TP901 family phage tail tape measure protein
MPTTEKVNVIITGQDKSKGAFQSAGKSASSLTTKIGTMAAVAIPALAIAMGTKAVQAASEWETAMSNVNTLMDDNGEKVAELETGIEDMMSRVPKSAKELGASAYAIVSAGINDTAETLKVLEESANLAVTGLGTTEEATDLMTSAINAFGLDAAESHDIANTFFEGVKGGKTTISELATGFGGIAPLAAQMGISLEDLVATTSALTATGQPASQVYSGLKGAFTNMLKPTADMQEAMDSAGITFDDVQKSLAGDGLVETIRMMTEASGGNTDQVAKMFGSVEGLNSVLALMNETGDEAIDILNGMEGGSASYDEALKKQNETTAAQYQLVKNQLNIAMKELGVVIIPILLKIIQTLIGFFGEMKNTLDLIIGGFKIWIDWIKDGIEWIDSLIGKIRDAIQAMRDLATQTGGKITGFISGIGSKLGFQSGGFVNAPLGSAVPALLHGGERVIPAGGRANAGGGGSNIVVNITGTFLSEDIALELGDMMIDRLKLQMRV